MPYKAGPQLCLAMSVTKACTQELRLRRSRNPHHVVTNGARHGQASWPHSDRANGLAVHSAAAHLKASILTALFLSLVVIQAVCVTDLHMGWGSWGSAGAQYKVMLWSAD